MCHAIVKVSYHSASEPSALIEIEEKGSFNAKLEEIKSRPGVRKISIFHPHSSHEIVSEWRTTNYNNQEQVYANQAIENIADRVGNRN